MAVVHSRRTCYCMLVLHAWRTSIPLSTYGGPNVRATDVILLCRHATRAFRRRSLLRVSEYRTIHARQELDCTNSSTFRSR